MSTSTGIAVAVLDTVEGPDAVFQTPIISIVRSPELCLRHLQGHRVHVETVERVIAGLAEVASVQEVEDPEVEEERIVGLADPAGSPPRRISRRR